LESVSTLILQIASPPTNGAPIRTAKKGGTITPFCGKADFAAVQTSRGWPGIDAKIRTQAREQGNCICPQSSRWPLRALEQVYMSIDGAITPSQQRGRCADGSVQHEGQAPAGRCDLHAMQAQPCFHTMMPGFLWGVWSILPHIHADPKFPNLNASVHSALPPRPLPGHWNTCVRVCVRVCVCVCACVRVCACASALAVLNHRRHGRANGAHKQAVQLLTPRSCPRKSGRAAYRARPSSCPAASSRAGAPAGGNQRPVAFNLPPPHGTAAVRQQQQGSGSDPCLGTMPPMSTSIAQGALAQRPTCTCPFLTQQRQPCGCFPLALQVCLSRTNRLEQSQEPLCIERLYLCAERLA